MHSILNGSIFTLPNLITMENIKDLVDELNLEVSNNTRRQLTLAKTKEFIGGGKAYLTIQNKQSGERRTYKFAQFKKLNNPNRIFVSLLTGQDNTRSYTYMGEINMTTLEYQHSRNSRIASSCASTKGVQYLLYAIHHQTCSENIEFWHEGRCCRCGRLLTTPESINSGIGPECARRKYNNK